jgi:hypothetical protein
MKKTYHFSNGVNSPYLKRIIVSVKIENALDVSKSLRCDAFVDTTVSLTVLPATWKDRLGSLGSTGIIELGTGIQEKIKGEVCGPVRIQIEGFRPIVSEVLLVEMKTEDEDGEPLTGHIVLAQCLARVDMVGHRLVPIKH